MSELMPAMLPKWARLRFEMASGLPLIEADPDQIRQAIMSLVINAGEAIGDSPGSVVVKSGIHFVEQSASTGTGELPPGRYVSIEVHDTGCGMDRETQERIFDPFFTTKFTGRGLGLAAVSGIVRAHRGAIFVYSAPAHGSTFRLLFPVMGAGQLRERPQAAGLKSEDLSGNGIVLVVDDEEAVRQTAATALARYGYTVELASDGAEGVALFSQDPARYSAILLDVTMPVLSGEHALQLIKKLRPDVPVIASSGYSETEVERRFPSAAVAAFLQKPYTGADLARVMKGVLRRTMARTQTNN
jgi:CheY-like chemotaxis protein